MKTPAGGNIRRPTDPSQVHNDMVLPPVNPEVGYTDMKKLKPGPKQQVTIRVSGKKL